jgi:hypothetical protein
MIRGALGIYKERGLTRQTDRVLTGIWLVSVIAVSVLRAKQSPRMAHYIIGPAANKHRTRKLLLIWTDQWNGY